MYLSRLALTDFRNYKQLAITLGPGLFLFYGDNAQGKTNLLEAVAMLATGGSFHATNDREVVNWQATDVLARVEGFVKRREGDLHIEIVIVDPAPPERERPGHPLRTLELPTNMP